MKNQNRIRQNAASVAAKPQAPAAALPAILQEITKDLDRREMFDLAEELEKRAAQIRSALVTVAASTAGTLEDANQVIEPDLAEFSMDLGAPGRQLLADRFGRWAKQLQESIAILRGQQFVRVNPNN